MSNFAELRMRGFYSTTGSRILQEVLLPVLNLTTSYDRLTGYFSVNSIVSVASGLEKLYEKKGKMRLVIGIHDVPGDLLAAHAMSTLIPNEQFEKAKENFFAEVGALTELTQKSAIAGLAWMIKLGFIQVKVAAPRQIEASIIKNE